MLFPAFCRVCGNSLLRFGRVAICDDCWNELAPQRGLVCLRCSEDLHISAFVTPDIAAFRPAELLCQACRLAPPPFERAVAYGGYTGTLRSLIHALKYDGMTPIAERLGALLAEAILKFEAKSASGADSKLSDAVVIAVPMHPSKQKQRGFNHAELLARGALKTLRTTRSEWRLTLKGDLLQRRRVTQSQSGLSPHQRRANLRGVFFAPRPEEIVGREILLIDDIYTTGATARACSQVLRRAGAASVWVATVARPQRENFAAPQIEVEELPMHEDVAFWGDRKGVAESHVTAAASR